MTCLDVASLEQFLSGDLDGAAADDVETHVSSCAACRGRLDDVAENLRVERALRANYVDAVLDGDAPEAGALPPDSFAGYAIEREIHRGAQGVVYRAVQQSTKRTVAIKVMREGPFADPRDTARFEREIDVLARLDHPNIVAIRDTGVAAGHSFFVMDFIAGQPLDVYMASGERSVRETLELFVVIARAVHAAHVRGIIHRDLKPSNIRVSAAGVPSVLDFGLAKVAAGPATMTATGQFLGSLPWASPEQAEGDPGALDVRSDVYALGVILYQMLTGRFPYDVSGSMRDVLENIIHRAPARPRAVRRAIDDDVETIVLTALEKDRARRYQGAGEMARDVERVLEGAPIEAKRDRTWYVLTRTLRRHRGPVALASSMVVVVLAFAIVMSVLYRRASAAEVRAEAQHARAVDEAAAARQVSDFLVSLFRVADPEVAAGRTVTARELLDQGARYVDAELAGQSEVQAALMLTMGRAYLELGRFEEAERLFDSAGSLRNGDASSRHWLGRAAHARHAYTEAEAHLEAALAAPRDELSTAERAAALTTLGRVRTDQGRFGEAEAVLDEAIALPEVDAETRASTLAALADLRAAERDDVEAERLLRTVLEMEETARGGRDHPRLVTARTALADAVFRNGRLADAERLQRDALAMAGRLYGETHPVPARVHLGLARTLVLLGASDEALEHAATGVAQVRDVYGDDHAATADALDRQAWVYYRAGRRDDAERGFLDALAIRRRVLPDDHPDLGRTHNGLGAIAVDRGDPGTARAHFEEALDALRAAFGDEHPEVATIRLNLAAVRADRRLRVGPQDLAAAERLCRDALDALRSMYGEDHPETADGMMKLAWVLHLEGRLDESETAYRSALDVRRRHSGARHPAVAVTLVGLGMLLTDLDRLDEAENALREARAICRETLGDEHHLAACADGALGACLVAQGRLDAAKPLLLGADARLRALGSGEDDVAARIRAAIVALRDAHPE